ncbi:hypothetical protein D3C85_1157640 [compost metagenome]
MTRLEVVVDAQFADHARLLRLGQFFLAQRVADARIAAAAVVVHRVQAQRRVVVEDGLVLVVAERGVEGLDQQHIAVTVDGEAVAAFDAAVKQAVGIGVFVVQLRQQRGALGIGGLQQGQQCGHGFSQFLKKVRPVVIAPAENDRIVR